MQLLGEAVVGEVQVGKVWFFFNNITKRVQTAREEESGYTNTTKVVSKTAPERVQTARKRTVLGSFWTIEEATPGLGGGPAPRSALYSHLVERDQTITCIASFRITLQEGLLLWDKVCKVRYVFYEGKRI